MALLTGLVAGLIALAIVMVVLAVKRWNERLRSAARVEALRSLVEESGRKGFHWTVNRSSTPDRL